jgi:hypothetical protein
VAALPPPPTPFEPIKPEAPQNPAAAPEPSGQAAQPVTAAAGFWDGLTARTVALDVAGLGFVGAAIYVALTHGTGQGDFGVLAALAGAYLGVKAGS